MKIVILGAGAIGCWIGAQLVRAKHDVTLIGRASLVQAVQQHGLRVNFVDGSQWQFDQQHLHASTALSADVLRGADVVILCMKAYAVASAIVDLQRFADVIQNATIIGFQNGFGTDDLLAQAFPHQPVIAATTTTPVSIETSGIIRIERMDGGIGMAAVSSGQRAVGNIAASLFDQPLLTAHSSQPTPHTPRPTLYPDYRAMRWSKLLLNVIGNASGAILDMPPAQLFADPQLF